MAAKTNRQIAIELGEYDAKDVLSRHPQATDKTYICQLIANSIKFHMNQARMGAATCKRKFHFTKEDEQAALEAANKVIQEKFSS